MVAREPTPAFSSTQDCSDFFVAAGIPAPQFLSGSADDQTVQQTFAARSKHPGGVVATYCDGSVCFTAATIDPLVWRALTTAWGNEIYVDPNKQ
jgi:putative intracellular protease/amidase